MFGVESRLDQQAAPTAKADLDRLAVRDKLFTGPDHVEHLHLDELR